jgi:DNA invertase Pin-like site-specific DNA recombinase
MTIAYSYIRFSHPDQRRGNSLRRQLNRSRAFATTRGLDLDDSIRDFARSAFHNRHTVTGNLGGFLALVREGKIAAGSYLLIESFDRLSRDEFWPAFDLIRDILRARIIIVTLPDDDEEHEYSYDGTNRNPALINEIIHDLSRSHRESKMKSARCGDACETQRADARAGLAKIPGRCPAWLEPIRGTIIVDGREKAATIAFKEKAELVEVVRLIFSLALSDMGVRSIAARLNREGRPKFGRTGWHHRTVAVLLHNREVMGFKQPRRMVDGVSVPDGDEIPDHFAEIIDPDTFYAVQGAIKGRNVGASGRHGKTLPNLLRGIARCVRCGGALHYVGIPGKSPSRRYLICSNGKRDLCENHKHYLYDPLERELLTILPLFDCSRLLAQPTPDTHRGPALAAQIAEKSEQLTALARRKITPETEVVMDELTDELAALRAQLAEFTLTARIAEVQASRDQFAEFVEMVGQMRRDEMSDDDRYILRAKLAQGLRRIVAEIVADGEKINIKLRSGGIFKIELNFNNQTFCDMTVEFSAPFGQKAKDRMPDSIKGHVLSERREGDYTQVTWLFRLPRQELIDNPDMIGKFEAFLPRSEPILML